MSKRSNPAREHGRDPSETGTDSRILDSAISLFAARGFGEVTVREIAEHAGANPAAISYYFGAKEQLIKRAIQAVIAPLNVKRLAVLSEVTSSSAPVTVDKVVRAMVEPTVEACMNGTGAERYYARMLLLGFALRQPFVEEVMAEQTDIVATKFVDALGLALPDAPRHSLFWRYDFMIGAIQHILLDPSRGYRLRRVSAGIADTTSSETMITELVDFIAAGIAKAQSR
jgi:AcrR family transcriptional regulator